VAQAGEDLEIVPDVVGGDEITLTPKVDGEAQTDWVASGWGSDKFSGKGAWKTKVRGFKRPGEHFWIPHFSPHVVTVKATAPDGREFVKNISAYPGDKFEISIGHEWGDRFEELNAFFKKWLGEKFKFELLKGKISASTGFREAEDSPKVFWSWDIEGGFSPLVGGHFEFDVDAIAFMNFIPSRIKKYVGEIKAFAEIGGGIDATIAYKKMKLEGHKFEKAEVKGIVTLAIGMKASAIKEKVLKAVAAGKSGMSAKIVPDEDGFIFGNPEKGSPSIRIQIKFEGINAEGSFELFDGWISGAYTAKLMDAKEFKAKEYRLPS